MDGTDGTLNQQLVRPAATFARLAERQRPKAPKPEPAQAVPPPALLPELESFNGLGGFSDNGREYVIRLHPNAGAIPPAPWINVVAHPTFGFVASDLGTGFTWSENSHDNRLTPWSNDPVSDPQGEAVFFRDEDSARVWSATPLPAGGGQPYTIRHGQGYSVYEHARDGIESRLLVYLAAAEPVKVFQIALRNTSKRRRQLSVTIYAEWVLGEHRERTGPHIVTRREPTTGALLALNAFRDTFADRVAFLDLFGGERRTLTGDRTEFIGRNGSLRAPAALDREELSNRTGATIDPCGAVQVRVTLEPGQEQTVIGLLGEAADEASVSSLVRRSRAPQGITAAFDDGQSFWRSLLGTVQVTTPDRAIDLMLNHWLLYQTLACRIWGRSAFYQSSGAFGFRDQLQDVLALLLAAPHLARKHILHAASRQFVEGDVQHWWHEPGGQGVRTQFSDDRLWLVYATLPVHGGDRRYGNSRRERAIPRRPGAQPGGARSLRTARRLAHAGVALRALRPRARGQPRDRRARSAAHGNRGLERWDEPRRSRRQGRKRLARLVPRLDPAALRRHRRGPRQRGAGRHVPRPTRQRSRARSSWRGTANGTAVPTSTTGRRSARRRTRSVASTRSRSRGRIVRRRRSGTSASGDGVRRTPSRAADDRIMLLLTPPFDEMTPSPGYIQGYVPGVRENGGQYTHAALWTVLAFARLGDGDRAADSSRCSTHLTHRATPT